MSETSTPKAKMAAMRTELSTARREAREGKASAKKVATTLTRIATQQKSLAEALASTTLTAEAKLKRVTAISGAIAKLLSPAPAAN